MIKIIKNCLIVSFLLLVTPNLTLYAADQEERKESAEPNLDLNEGYGVEKTALHCAVIYGNKELTRSLIHQGASLGRLTNESQAVAAIHLAVMHNHESIVMILVEARANINQRDWLGRTALYLATEKNQDNLVNYLIFTNADVDQPAHNDETALVAAARRNHIKVFISLLEAGADPNCLMHESEHFKGLRMLGWAIANDNKSVAQALIKGGVDLNLSCCEKAYHDTVEKEKKQIAEIIRALKIDIDPTSPVSDITPLTLALLKKNQTMALFLIIHGVDTKLTRNYFCQDESGLQSLDLAVEAICNWPVCSLARSILTNLPEALARLIAEYVLGVDPALEEALQAIFR